MNKYFTIFVSQLIIIGFYTNIRTDTPFWKQLVAYCLIACILPAAEFLRSFTEKY